MAITIDGFLIDASLRENHTYPNEVTSEPVESGADITDHVLVKPIEVTIEGVVSDTPTGDAADARGVDTVPSEDALQILEGISNNREPVVIESSLRVFEDMVLENLDIPRDARTGAALQFAARFRQIILVTNDRTTLRTSTPRAKRRVSRGAKGSPTLFVPLDLAARIANLTLAGGLAAASQL